MSTQVGTRRVGLWQATVRRLLELDKPVPDHTEEELEAQAATNYNWNFLWNVGDGVFFWFGLSFISATTILPLYVSKLSSNEFWIALLGVLSAASWYLPQLFTAGGTEQLAQETGCNQHRFSVGAPAAVVPAALGAGGALQSGAGTRHIFCGVRLARPWRRSRGAGLVGHDRPLFSRKQACLVFRIYSLYWHGDRHSWGGV